ncbi:hypothetical protein [Spiribacter insolitus]|uniref:DUF2232 domain-containing protein n=1 Tax=Spiribacter insolitus TaxID=3122417 RepID=A0ABV3T872_9GAMM
MQAFLAFVMRTRLGAIGVVALGALLPLLFWVSGGALALITLRRGLAEGAIVLAGATAVLVPIYAGLLGAPMAVLQPLALVWLPVMALAQILRSTVSLATTLQLGTLLAAAGVLAFYGLHGDPAAFWEGTLQAIASALTDGRPGPEWSQAAAQLAPRLTGLWVTNLLAVAFLCLLLGRWWQAVLYNPGGFRSEFHGLRFARWFAGLGVAAVLAGMFGPPGLVADVGLVIGAVFLLQALAVAHALVAARGWHVGWLVGFYLILPLLLRPVALLGLADTFVDFRARFAPAA